MAFADMKSECFFPLTEFDNIAMSVAKSRFP